MSQREAQLMMDNYQPEGNTKTYWICTNAMCNCYCCDRRLYCKQKNGQIGDMKGKQAKKWVKKTIVWIKKE